MNRGDGGRLCDGGGTFKSHPQTTSCTDLDIGSESSVTTMVFGLFYVFEMEYNMYPPPEITFEEELN